MKWVFIVVQSGMENSLEQLVPYNDSSICPICFEACDNSKVLPCNHTMCPDCTTKISTVATTFSCPLCRSEVVPVHGRHDFRELHELEPFDERIEVNDDLIHATIVSYEDKGVRLRSYRRNSSSEQVFCNFNLQSFVRQPLLNST